MVARVTRRRAGDDDPDGDTRLPIGVTPATNGEYIPDPPTRHDLDASGGEGAKVGTEDRHRERVITHLGGGCAERPVVPSYIPAAQDRHCRLRREVIEPRVAVAAFLPVLEVD